MNIRYNVTVFFASLGVLLLVPCSLLAQEEWNQGWCFWTATDSNDLWLWTVPENETEYQYVYAYVTNNRVYGIPADSEVDSFIMSEQNGLAPNSLVGLIINYQVSGKEGPVTENLHFIDSDTVSVKVARGGVTTEIQAHYAWAASSPNDALLTVYSSEDSYTYSGGVASYLISFNSLLEGVFTKAVLARVHSSESAPDIYLEFDNVDFKLVVPVN